MCGGGGVVGMCFHCEEFELCICVASIKGIVLELVFSLSSISTAFGTPHPPPSFSKRLLPFRCGSTLV